MARPAILQKRPTLTLTLSLRVRGDLHHRLLLPCSRGRLGGGEGKFLSLMK